MLAHYLNTTASPLTANITVKLTTVDPATVNKWVAQIFLNKVGLIVPPGSGVAISTTCKIPATFGPIELLGGVSHMHKHAIHFKAVASTGANLYETDNWDSPQEAVYATPLRLNPSDSITFTCTYNNNTGGILTFGESAATNEMCIFSGRFTSSPNGDDIACQSF
jgi:hypothetical protein